MRPPIEGTLDPDSVLTMLPRDHAGNVDWAAAFRNGVIAPRPAVGEPPARWNGEGFAFDFFLPGPNEMFDALFPHSTHTEWLACQQCHSRIFRYRNTPVSMGDIFAGKYCGECHGRVAFPVATACERCHVGVEQPPNRAQPVLLGDILMSRRDSAADTTSIAAGVRTGSLPLARFPHWVHRIRYQCKACHLAIFEPRRGANAVVMRDIAEGRACGQCHDGVTAFRPEMANCDRCHVPAVEDASSG